MAREGKEASGEVKNAKSQVGAVFCSQEETERESAMKYKKKQKVLNGGTCKRLLNTSGFIRLHLKVVPMKLN